MGIENKNFILMLFCQYLTKFKNLKFFFFNASFYGESEFFKFIYFLTYLTFFPILKSIFESEKNAKKIKIFFFQKKKIKKFGFSVKICICNTKTIEREKVKIFRIGPIGPAKMCLGQKNSIIICCIL